MPAAGYKRPESSPASRLVSGSRHMNDDPDRSAADREQHRNQYDLQQRFVTQHRAGAGVEGFRHEAPEGTTLHSVAGIDAAHFIGYAEVHRGIDSSDHDLEQRIRAGPECRPEYREKAEPAQQRNAIDMGMHDRIHRRRIRL